MSCIDRPQARFRKSKRASLTYILAIRLWIERHEQVVTVLTPNQFDAYQHAVRAPACLARHPSDPGQCCHAERFHAEAEQAPPRLLGHSSPYVYPDSTNLPKVLGGTHSMLHPFGRSEKCQLA